MRLISIFGAVVFALFFVFVSTSRAQDVRSVEELRARVRANPDSGADWYALGLALQERQEYEPALEAFERAVELEYQPGGALMRSAQIFAAQGDLEEALRRLERVAEINPMALSFLPQIGGIPQLEDDPRLQGIIEEADRARYPCRARPESRRFDFWLGEWSVSNPQGQVVGENVVTVDLEGCVVRESWTDAYGGRGTSVNFYDPATGRWHQVWTSDNGTITHYEGEWRDGAMRFVATGFGDADGRSRHRRMTFTPNLDGSVRQLIEVSEDGATWTVGFDGLYRKKTPGD